VERTNSLERFQITNSQEDFQLPTNSERRIVRVNSFRDLVVQSSGSPTGPFIGPEGQDPFWTAGIFRWDLFG
jgi:putative SOS response-associated peptidase YedK